MKKVQHIESFAVKYITLFFIFFTVGSQLIAQKKLNTEKLDDAVGVLITYDKNNNLLGSSGCFCIDPNGYFYSNYKFLKHCDRAEVRLGNGETYKVTKIVAMNENKDLVKFQVKKTGSQEMPFLEIETKEVKKGIDAVSLLPAFNSLFMDKYSHGYIYNIYTDDITGLKRFKADKSTPLLIGGCPLINAYGRVIGITSPKSFENSNSDQVDWAIAIDEFEKIKTVSMLKFGEENTSSYNCSFYAVSDLQKNDISLFVDDSYLGDFEKVNFDGVSNCNAGEAIKKNLAEGKHSFLAYEHSTGSIWKGDFFSAKNDSCNLIAIPNSASAVSKKVNLDRYDQEGVQMNKAIDVSNQNNTTTNNNQASSGNGNNPKKPNSKPFGDFKNYLRFDMGFEHQNFMAHNGWPTYALALQFEKNFEGTPFSRNYRISVGMNDSSDFYLHMPAGPLAGLILLMLMNSQQDYCSGVAASTLLFILPDGFAVSPIKNEKMELGIYANFLGIDICKTNRIKPTGGTYSPIDYAPDFGARFNYYFNDKLYLFSRVSGKYSTIFAGWGAQATVGIGFEFEK